MYIHHIYRKLAANENPTDVNRVALVFTIILPYQCVCVCFCLLFATLWLFRASKVCYFMKSVEMKNVTNQVWIIWWATRVRLGRRGTETLSFSLFVIWSDENGTIYSYSLMGIFHFREFLIVVHMCLRFFYISTDGFPLKTVKYIFNYAQCVLLQVARVTDLFFSLALKVKP